MISDFNLHRARYLANKIEMGDRYKLMPSDLADYLDHEYGSQQAAAAAVMLVYLYMLDII